MSNHQWLVEQFHRAMGIEVKPDQFEQDVHAARGITDLDLEHWPLIARLIEEEFDELTTALIKGDKVAAADALADLEYVIRGAARAWGIPHDAVFAEVHRSNMAKVGGPVRADGKRLKPEGWTPPDVAGVLARPVIPDAHCQDCKIPFETIPKSLNYSTVPGKGDLCHECWRQWRREAK